MVKIPFPERPDEQLATVLMALLLKRGNFGDIQQIRRETEQLFKRMKVESAEQRQQIRIVFYLTLVRAAKVLAMEELLIAEVSLDEQ